MNWQILKDEIALALYSAMTDAEIVTELNAVDKQRNKTVMTGSEVWNAVDVSEYESKTDAQRAELMSFCGVDEHDPFGVSADFIIAIFGGGSATVSTLATLRVELVSRAIILELPVISLGDIEYVRTI